MVKDDGWRKEVHMIKSQTAFATVVTPKYLNYALVALRSLKDNSGFNDITCYIFYGGPETGHFEMTEHMLKKLKVFYNNLIFQKIDYNKYRQHSKVEPHYWSHEAFNIKGHDRVIFVDADIICLGKLHDLPYVDLGMTWEQPRNQFYAGFFILGKRYLNEGTYNALLRHRKSPITWGRDQGVYNEFFKKDQITTINPKYNIVTPSQNFPIDMPSDIRILHYIYKPDPQIGKNMLIPEHYNLWHNQMTVVNSQLKAAGLR